MLNIQYFLEAQAVSSRRRAFTRAHTRPTSENWKEELYQKFQSILLIASWGPRTFEHEVEESFDNCLPSIFIAINELCVALDEKFTSADLEIFVIECDKMYDPANMEEAYGDGRLGRSSGKRAPEAIVGTTGIGLGKFIRETEDTLLIRSLFPAKVVLWSTLNKALGPTILSIQLNKKRVEITDGANQDGANQDGANQDGRD